MTMIKVPSDSQRLRILISENRDLRAQLADYKLLSNSYENLKTDFAGQKADYEQKCHDLDLMTEMRIYEALHDKAMLDKTYREKHENSHQLANNICDLESLLAGRDKAIHELEEKNISYNEWACKHFEKQAERIKELEKDRERLDWVRESKSSLSFYTHPDVPPWVVERGYDELGFGDTPRNAIDASRNAEETK